MKETITEIIRIINKGLYLLISKFEFKQRIKRKKREKNKIRKITEGFLTPKAADGRFEKNRIILQKIIKIGCKIVKILFIKIDNITKKNRSGRIKDIIGIIIKLEINDVNEKKGKKQIRIGKFPKFMKRGKRKNL